MKVTWMVGSLLIALRLPMCAAFSVSVGAIGFPGLTEGKSVALLVVDSGFDGFLGFGDGDRRDADVRLFPLMSGAKVGDDQILAVMQATLVDGKLGFESGVVSVDPNESPWAGVVTANAPMALMVLYDGDLQEGARVGLYRSDAITDAGYGANHAYRVPASGVDATLLSVSEGKQLFGGPLGNVTNDAFVSKDTNLGAPQFGAAVETLVFTPPVGGQGMMAELATPAAGLYVVETSSDLVHWSLLEERDVSASGGSWEVTDGSAGTRERAFYRWWRALDS